jgi:hypothetical protein
MTPSEEEYELIRLYADGELRTILEYVLNLISSFTGCRDLIKICILFWR